MTNPNNLLEGNAIAGGANPGYEYYLLHYVTGLSNWTNPSYRPDQAVFGGFVNNSVHSCGTYGVRIYPRYIPITLMANSSFDWGRAMFQGLVAWKNERGMQYVFSRIVQIKDAIIFDNSDFGIACLSAVDYQFRQSPGESIFYDRDLGSVVRNSVIIGDSQTSSSPIVPSTSGLIGTIVILFHR